MALTSGAKLGPYEIVAPLGAGGMGEVYRATDLKLGRDIALKVILQEFAQDAQLMARFQHEAQVLASLNHTNIASLYGLEESGGVRALVMELVEGPTLAERIREGAIPIEEALPIAKQITEALEYAHERGIIHRDLKPANIKLTADGKVKVLDFGLAKALQGDASPRNISNSPTLTMSATKVGMILGTAAYMSPEQAKGKTVDRRTDIWSFGAVLFEMLTGRQMFVGETATDIMAAVVRAEPDWTILPKGVPRRIRELLHRCLLKDEKRRLRDIGDARLDLDDALDTTPDATSMPPPNPLRRALPWAIAGAALVIAASTLFHRSGIDTASREVMSLEITYPANVEPVSGIQGGFAVSPDGRAVAMIGVRDGVRSLNVRRLDRAEATEINDTSGVTAACFSPDGTSVAFIPGSGLLTRLSLADQQRAILASGTDLGASNLTWGSTEIVYNRGGALWIVPAQGGTPSQLTVLDAARHEVLHGDPAMLPGGRTVVFTSLTTELGTERIEAVSIDGRQRSVVIERAATPVWSPSGHLLFGRDGAVWAAPFDPNSATVRGAAVPVIPSGVVGAVRSGSLGFELSSTGTLVFVPADFDYKRVVSVGRDGSEVALNLPPNRYGNPRISPDGRRLLIESAGSVIETLDLVRGTRAKLTAAALGTGFSTWTADGKGVVFKRLNVPFWMAADGSGRAGTVPGGLTNDYPSSPGPDSDSILDVRIQPESSGDIFLMSISGKFQPKPLLVTPAYEGGAQLSPDGRWLLYQSNESGQPEIYVRRYPAMERQWQVSEGGGVQARWSRTSREIYYRSGQHMMAVAFDASGAEPTFGKPTPLFADEYDFGQNISIANYDVTRDGRFIMLRRGTHGSSLRYVIHWTEELKQILAAGGAR
jgi:serine/threonine protein kinase/Tol biopolymer transport system component